MSRKLFSAICAMSLLASSCTHKNALLGPKTLAPSIADEAIAYSQARRDATTGILFSAILEARDRGVVGYNTVTGITSTPVFVGKGETTLSPLGLGNPTGPFQGSSATISDSRTAQGQYGINPIAKDLDDGASVLLTPLDGSILVSYHEAGWPNDVLLSLLVGKYKMEKNGAWEINDGKNPSDFIRRIESKADLKNIRIENFKISSDACVVVKINDIKELVGLGTSTDETLKGKLSTFAEYTGKSLKIELKKLNPEGDSDSDEIKPVYKLCDKPTTKLAIVWDSDYVNNHENSGWKKGEDPELIELEMRTFDQAIYFVGETLRHQKPYVRQSCDALDEEIKDTAKSISSSASLIAEEVREERGEGFESDPVYISSKSIVKAAEDIRNQSPSNDRSKISPKVPLITVTPGPLRSKKPYAVSTYHKGHQVYTVKRRENEERCSPDRSQTVFALLMQIFELQQSKSFLKAPDSIIIR